MSDTLFSHQKANSSEARYTEDGLRAFFAYRDMGIIDADSRQIAGAIGPRRAQIIGG